MEHKQNADRDFLGDQKVAADKKAARALARSLLKNLSAAQREEQSQKAAASFLNSSIYKNASCIAAFFSLPQEADTLPIIARAFMDKKRVLLPRVAAGSNEMNFYELAPVIPALDCPRSVKSAVESHPISKWSEATYAGIFLAKDCRVKPGNDTVEAATVMGLEAQTESNAWGIREPLETLPLIEKKDIPSDAVILVPGLAFAKDGRRLGRGKGFYDRYLSELLAANPAFAAQGKICGYCMALQIAEDVPTEENDILMQEVFC